VAGANPCRTTRAVQAFGVRRVAFPRPPKPDTLLRVFARQPWKAFGAPDSAMAEHGGAVLWHLHLGASSHAHR
jgi:hypothetical protein